MSISTLAVRRPVAVAMFFVAVVLLGMISFSRLPVDLLPDVSYPQLVIYTSYPDVAPAEVERQVTERIERQVASVPGVERITSVSRDGASLVTLRFAWGTNMDFAMLNTRERLDNVRQTLPEQAGRPQILRVDPESEPVMSVSVAGDDLWEAKELAESVIRRRLEQLDGVAQALVTGGLEREIRVEVNPELLEAHGLTIQTVADALAAANHQAAGGTVLEGRTRYPLRTLGQFQSVEEIEEVVVGRRSTPGGGSRAIEVRDVARVVDGFADREALTRYNGLESVGLLVFKESGANTVHVAGLVNEVLERLETELDGISLDVAHSQAGFIRDAISNVVSALVLGGMLAFLVLFVFLRQPRYPVAVALAIPISVVGTFALMHASGVSLNIMSLGGLALGVGMLVDNSIIVLENIFRLREEGRERLEAASEGAWEVAGAITASTFTTIAVFGPIIYVEGVAGELFRDLSLSVAFSLAASLLVALTLLPAAAARFAGRPGGGRAPLTAGTLPRRAVKALVGRPLASFDRTFAGFAARYEQVLQWSLDRRAAVLTLAAGALAGAVGLALTLDRNLLPRVDQGAFEVRVELPEGTALERTDQVARQVEAVLGEDPDVEAVFGLVGRDARGFASAEEASGLHTARFQVRVREGAATDRVIERLDEPLGEAAPDAAVTLHSGQATALGQLLGGTDADIAVRIHGQDLDVSRALAEDLLQELSAAGRIKNLRLGSERGHPEYGVEVLRYEAARFGIDPEVVASAVEQAMRGVVATEFVWFDRRVPIVVRLPDGLRYDRATLNQLRVQGVPLQQLIRVEASVGAAEIRREDQGRVVTVLADVRRGGLDAAVEEVNRVAASVMVPSGTRLEVGGENQEMRRSFRDLAFAFGLALILVYLILAAQFESFVHPLIILVAVPLALVGAILALVLAGAGLNTMSLIGMVILVGIVVNDSIVKVDFIVRARDRGVELRESVIEAGRIRLRPIVMTTVTTVLGLTPMALGLGRGADLRAPLAIAVIGGLVVASVLTLVLVPVLFSVVEEARIRFAGLRSVPEAKPHPSTHHDTVPVSAARGGGGS